MVWKLGKEITLGRKLRAEEKDAQEICGKYLLNQLVWWVVPDWMAGAHQSRSITPPPQLDRGEKI